MHQHLIFDADDTLWENNIYFEQATHAFIDFLHHSSLKAHEIQAVLDEVERVMGYGTANFTKSLVQTYHRLIERQVSDEDVQWIHQLAEKMIRQPFLLIEGVQETLAYLAPRHTLYILTKGDEEEQKLKVERSGLESLFQQVVIVHEKQVQTYKHMLENLSLDPHQTWMIGNSPKSDINPALTAGLNAVYIPHAHTWHLEHQETTIPRGEQQLLILQSFTELRLHF